MQALKPIYLVLSLFLVSVEISQAQADYCHMYSGILRKADSLSRAGNYVVAIKTYRAARVACPSRVYETDQRVEQIVYRLMQMREQAIQRRDEVLQQMNQLEKELTRARFNEEVAEKKARMALQVSEPNNQVNLRGQREVSVKVAPPVQKDPWDLLRTGHYQEALTLLEAAAFTDAQDSLSLMRLAHANLFNGRIETAEGIYRVLKPLPYGAGKYASFAEAYLKDFSALENAESTLGKGQVIPLSIRDAYLSIRTDLENYAQALALAKEEQQKSNESAVVTLPEKMEQVAVETIKTIEAIPPVEKEVAPPVEKVVSAPVPTETKALIPDTIVQTEQPATLLAETNPVPTETNNLTEHNVPVKSEQKAAPLARATSHSREKLEEDRPLPPAPEFVLKSLINTEIENKASQMANKPGEPTAYIAFIGDFDLNDYYAQRTLKRVRDQYGVLEARIRYFGEVLKYRIVLGEFSTKEEAAQYTLNFEQKYRERVSMGVMY